MKRVKEVTKSRPEFMFSDCLTYVWGFVKWEHRIEVMKVLLVRVRSLEYMERKRQIGGQGSMEVRD